MKTSVRYAQELLATVLLGSDLSLLDALFEFKP